MSISICSTVVGHSTQHRKILSSNPASGTLVREKIWKELLLKLGFIVKKQSSYLFSLNVYREGMLISLVYKFGWLACWCCLLPPKWCHFALTSLPTEWCHVLFTFRITNQSHYRHCFPFTSDKLERFLWVGIWILISNLWVNLRAYPQNEVLKGTPLG